MYGLHAQGDLFGWDGEGHFNVIGVDSIDESSTAAAKDGA